MSSANFNGWADEPEEEREALGLASEDEEPWRGDEHPDSWPEYLAGPEYWLHKNEIRDDAED